MEQPIDIEIGLEGVEYELNKFRKTIKRQKKKLNKLKDKIKALKKKYKRM